MIGFWRDRRATLDDIPRSVRERAKRLFLDGVACAFVGAHVASASLLEDWIDEAEPYTWFLFEVTCAGKAGLPVDAVFR